MPSAIDEIVALLPEIQLMLDIEEQKYWDSFQKGKNGIYIPPISDPRRRKKNKENKTIAYQEEQC